MQLLFYNILKYWSAIPDGVTRYKPITKPTTSMLTIMTTTIITKRYQDKMYIILGVMQS